LNGEPTNELFAKAIVVVANYQLVKVVAKKLENNAHMFPENHEIFDSDHIRLLIIVFLLNVTQDSDFSESLL